MKHMKLKTQKRNFFTLLEVSLSISILAIGMIGILAAFPAGVTAGKSAVESTKAMAIVDGVLAKLEEATPSQMDVYTSGSYDWIAELDFPCTGKNDIEDYSSYSVRIHKEYVSDYHMYFVTIYINYQTKSVCTFQSYIYIKD